MESNLSPCRDIKWFEKEWFASSLATTDFVVLFPSLSGVVNLIFLNFDVALNEL